MIAREKSQQQTVLLRRIGPRIQRRGCLLERLEGGFEPPVCGRGVGLDKHCWEAARRVVSGDGDVVSINSG